MSPRSDLANGGPPPPAPSVWRRSSAWIPLGLLAALISAVGVSWARGGIVAHLIGGDAAPADRLAALRAWFDGFGPWAPLVYVGVVTVEVVVAPLPGLMLYAPGGVIFGGFLGGLLALIGNVVGAGLSAWATRRVGRRLLERYVDGERLAALECRLRTQGTWIIFLLRVNPLTSSDLVSYAAGLTGVPTSRVMLGTLLGMAPLCWLQACAADELLGRYPQLVGPLVGIGLAYVVAVVWVVWRMLRLPAPPL